MALSRPWRCARDAADSSSLHCRDVRYRSTSHATVPTVFGLA
ncbi:hypothetical protein [Methylorubrum sp. Q1]|nr:hypothetical protein [Methylorubrum sp. Q1]